MKTISLTRTILYGILIVFLSPAAIFASTIIVGSIADLQKAIHNAVPGDVILLKNGIYTTTEDIVVNKEGSKQQPITIAAEQTGKVEITGKGGFNLVNPAKYIIIKGFKFTHLASKAKTGNGTSFCRFTQNIFETPGDGENLTISGSDQEVDYNTFQNKNAMGRFIAIRGSGKQIAERLHIHHNYFYKAASQGGKNGAEAFQFGLSGFSMSFSNSVVEYNLFEQCEGENELISVKVGGVILRYNTINDCRAQFTLRHGNKNLVYGNYFKNTPGLRIFGDDHQIFSNYFENCDPAITIGNGGAEVADGAPLVSHDRPDRILIAFNTLINNKQNIVQTPRKDGLGATYVTVAANLIQGGEGLAAKISGPMVQAVWKSNVIFNVAGAGDMPGNSYQTIDPKLLKSDNGIFHLSAKSPLINSISEHYPAVLVDIDGQPRTGLLDPGADEYSSTTIKANFLQPNDVGYLAKK
ncbi:MAG: polysaccharide lyase 6 family protein [Bacteroidota bacterium]